MRLKQLIYAAILFCAVAADTCGQEARRAIFKPTLRYPDVAKQMRLVGTVVGTVKVEVIIGPDGKVKTTNIVGGHPVLIDATLATLKEWRYEPEKSETTLTLIFDFHP